MLLGGLPPMLAARYRLSSSNIGSMLASQLQFGPVGS